MVVDVIHVAGQVFCNAGSLVLLSFRTLRRERAFVYHDRHAEGAGRREATIQIFGDHIGRVQVEAARRIGAAVPIDNHSVATQGNHSCDLIGNDSFVVLVVTDIDVLGTPKPGLIVKQDFARRARVEHGVEDREIHIARDGIHNNRLSFSIRRLRAVAGEWRSAIRRHSPL